MEVATYNMLECSLSVIAISAEFVSAGREQLGHDSQNTQHPLSSSGEFIISRCIIASLKHPY